MSARPIAVIDAETDPFKRNRIPAPFIWGYYNGKIYRTFDTTAELVAFISDRAEIIYAHNGGRFDWHFMLPYLAAYDDIMIINGRIAKMHIGRAECRDSYNIIPVPLSAYKKDDIDYRIMEVDQRNKPDNAAAIRDYLRSDCVYLFNLVSRFVTDYGIQLTQASAAMKRWKSVSARPLPRSDATFYDDMSKYYYGGRVECFEKGIIDAEFSVYDINSAYPYAMLHEHPYSIEYGSASGYVEGADFYTVHCPSRGMFPVRPETGGLTFPADGTARSHHVTKWEYEAAREYGLCDDDDVITSLEFNERINFAEYINHFYELRLKAKAEKDEEGSLLTKLLMNSLYGKFAANPDNYSNYMIVPLDMIAGIGASGWNFAGTLGPWGLAQAPLTDEQKRYYNVATGASITGFVRAMLWKAMKESKGVLYCDTDSIAVRRIGKAITLSEMLGAWKHEGNFDRAGIAGKKLYIFRGIKNAKGQRDYKTASKGARLTNSQLWEVARGGEVDYVPEAPTFSTQRAPTFTPRRIRYTALNRRVSRLHVARLQRSRQLALDFGNNRLQSLQGVLDFDL